MSAETSQERDDKETRIF